MKNFLIFARFLVLSFLLGTSFQVLGQDSNIQIIRLKAGGAVLGQVVDHDLVKGYKIVLAGGDTILLNSQSVSTVIEQKKAYRIFPDGKFTPVKGKYFSFLIGTNFGMNEDDVWNAFQLDISPITFSAGYRFNQQLEIGAGTGVDLYTRYGPFLPLFAEFRYYINQKPTSLFIGGKLGNGFLINPNGIWFNNESKGGILFHPVIGWKSATRRKSKFLIEAGLKIQKAQLRGWNSVDEITMFRYTFGMGWLF